jgi:hypothetical protein
MLAAGDKSERVQRKAVAAFGELLFFISHQGPAQEVFAPVRHPALKCRACKQQQWQVPPFAPLCLAHGIMSSWRSEPAQSGGAAEGTGS